LPDQPESGLVIIDKPTGWTSHQVVGRIRRLVGTRKVGHAGTLDPMATGVLIIGVGKATRLLGYLSRADKAYEATIRLGIGTVTDDAEGDVVSATGAADLRYADVEEAIGKLRGEILQVPSAVSAIKISGERSYARVRAGLDVELPARPVRISRFEARYSRRSEVAGVPVLDLDVEVECSTGTYIRALARDLGNTLGVGGHLTVLRRTRAGPFGIDEARPLDDAEPSLTIMPLETVVSRYFTTLTITDTQAGLVRNGRRLSRVRLPSATTALLADGGNFLALYHQEGSDAVAEVVFV
jgi:tRNA pseudouridine55 synthase